MVAAAAAPDRITSESAIDEFAYLNDMSVVLPILCDRLETTLLPRTRITGATLLTRRNKTYEHDSTRPKSSTLLEYRLSVTSADRQEEEQVSLYLRAFLDPVRARRQRPRTIPIPELSAYAWMFPADPAITGLEALVDPAASMADLPAEVSEFIDMPEGLGRPTSFTSLRYKPEDRCTLRVTFPSRDGEPSSVIAKAVASNARARRLHHISQAVWQHSQGDGACFRVPRPLGFDSEQSILWAELIPGRAPTRESVETPELVRIAKALASFHSGPPISERRHGPEDQLKDTNRKARALCVLLPSLGGPLMQLQSELARQVPPTNQPATANIHGAFRFRQLLLHNRDVGILDFDSLALGDPLEDLADFLLDLSPDPARWSESASNVPHFLRAYEEASGTEIHADRLGWHVRVQLVKRAYWLRKAAHAPGHALVDLTKRVELACAVGIQSASIPNT